MSSGKSWNDFSDEDFQRIAKVRAENIARKVPTAGTFKKMCRACEKPNALEINFCTGCGFALDDAGDRELQPENVFSDLIKGLDTGTNVVFRDSEYLVFDDKFGVSDNHLDIIPIRELESILSLTREDIPMLERMYTLGVNEFARRLRLKYNASIQLYEDVDFRDYVVAGYNLPVSIKHLHLHFVLPPFRHEKVFQYPRWHSHAKVMRDLRKHGRVIPYTEEPNVTEGEGEYARAIRLSREFEEILRNAAPARTSAGNRSAAAPESSNAGIKSPLKTANAATPFDWRLIGIGAVVVTLAVLIGVLVRKPP